ncbi:hypothetical protein [Pseudotabrizicola sp. 4114]|uniref:hypothetical protein n=1 Tax=Pseudotabrizicola sp. 4114 TaxID=2817731 RepID=UPI00285B9350|nr:hypothetical protein [Pseudorhodobacter sp. 4114]
MSTANLLSSRETWKDILFADDFYLSQRTEAEKSRLLATWYKDFMTSDFDLPQIDADSVVFFRSLVRDDYRTFFELVRDNVDFPCVTVQDYKKRRSDGRLNLAASKFLISNKKLFDLVDARNGFEQSLLYIRSCMYKYILDHFRSQPKPKAVVFFADMQPIEHLLARHFRAMGVPTVTLQHGLYVDYGDYHTVNKINYLHQPSEYFLSWGPETSELIARHHPTTRIVECGKPLIFNASPPPGAKPAQPYVSLFLDQKPFQAQNIEMIETVLAYAQPRGLEVKVRFHPSLPKAEILLRYPGMAEQLHFTDAALIVGHTSSLLYEALALGCRVMRFATEIPAIPLPDNSQFSTLQELEQKLTLPQEKDLWRRYFTALGEDALKNYRAFFDELLNNRKVMTA